VKLLIEANVIGEPNKDKIDEFYNDQFKIFKEVILLVRAQSFDHAYKIAEEKAEHENMDYYNPYDQLVQRSVIEYLDCFWLFDDDLESGTELYSRRITMPKDTDLKQFIDKFYPEVLSDDEKEHELKFVYFREFWGGTKD